MSKLLIVAGNRSEKLAEFMRDRGTFVVEHCYESFSKDINKIKLSIIKADKTLYLYQPGSDHTINSIRSDMQALSNLLRQGSFFDPGEITFMLSKADPNSRKAVEYFKSVMDSVHYTDYKIKVLEQVMSYANIYDSLLGVSHSQDFDNKRVNRYRVERGNDAKTAYEPVLNPDLSIEPFDFDSVHHYEEAKENAIRVESGLEYIDEENKIEQFDNPTFSRININKDILLSNLVVISGLVKSGVSTLSCAVASSLSKAGKSVLVLDYTDNSDIVYTFESSNISYNEYSMVDLIRRHDVNSGSINVCTVKTENEDNVKFEFLQNYFSKKSKFSVVLLVISSKDLAYVHNLLHTDISKYLLTSTILRKDIPILNDLIMSVNDKKVTVVLNNRIVLINPIMNMPYDEIKSILPQNVKLVAPVNFSNLNLGSSFAAKLLEG